MQVCIPGSRGEMIAAGDANPTRVMALIGATHLRDSGNQVEKLEALAEMSGGPDIVSDLSLVALEQPLWKRALSMGFAAASLPIYTVGRQNARIDPLELLDKTVEQMEGTFGAGGLSRSLSGSWMRCEVVHFRAP